MKKVFGGLVRGKKKRASRRPTSPSGDDVYCRTGAAGAAGLHDVVRGEVSSESQSPSGSGGGGGGGGGGVLRKRFPAPPPPPPPSQFGYKYALSEYSRTIPTTMSNDDGRLAMTYPASRTGSHAASQAGDRSVDQREEDEQRRGGLPPLHAPPPGAAKAAADDDDAPQYEVVAGGTPMGRTRSDGVGVGAAAGGALAGRGDVRAASWGGGGDAVPDGGGVPPPAAAAGEVAKDAQRKSILNKLTRSKGSSVAAEDPDPLQPPSTALSDEGAGAGSATNEVSIFYQQASSSPTREVVRSSGSQNVGGEAAAAPAGSNIRHRFVSTSVAESPLSSTDGQPLPQPSSSSAGDTSGLPSTTCTNNADIGSEDGQYNQYFFFPHGMYGGDGLDVDLPPSPVDGGAAGRHGAYAPTVEPAMPDATYEETYGDAYVGAPIKYVYPSGYQTLRPRSGPWKLSLLIFAVFLWLSVFIVGYCADMVDAEAYNEYADIDDDTIVIETRWCGSRVLYFMWVVSISITGMAAAYCSIIGYIQVRDFVVANCRSQPPGMVGKSDYYVRIDDMHPWNGVPTGPDGRGGPGGSSGGAAAPPLSYQTAGSRLHHDRKSIYQADGTPQFWGGHIYRPTQAAVAVTSR